MQAMQEQLQNLSRFDHVAFTSRNGIHAVMHQLASLHGSKEAAVHTMHAAQVQCWALGSDAEVLRDMGVAVETPAEVTLQLCEMLA